MRTISKLCAVLLPVLLGFGLIYLHAIGEITASSAFLILAGAGVLFPAVAALRYLQGTSTRMRVPWPLSERASKVPPTASTRSRIVARP